MSVVIAHVRAVVWLVVLALPINAAGQPPEPEPETEPETKPAPPSPPPIQRKPVMMYSGPLGAGITDASDYGKYPLSLYGLLQVRDTLTKVGLESSPFTNALAVHRARLLAGGYIASPKITYFLFAGFGAGDFEPGNGAALFDAVVTFALHRDLVVRVGQFAYSVDRQAPIPPFIHQMIDRSPVVLELGAATDVGVQLGSNNLFGLGDRFKYKLYVGSGEGRNQAAVAPVGFVYAARIEVNPFGKFDDSVEADLERSSRPRLSLGVGAGFNHKAQRDHGNFGPRYTLGGFDYRSAAADLMFKFAGLSILTEVMVRTSDQLSRTGVGADGMPKTEYSRSGLGYFVQAGYMLPSFVELAGRFSRLIKQRDTDPALEQEIRDRGQELGGTVSWYVFRNHGMKLQADYFYQYGSEGGAARHQARAQLQASF
jgi:hypothetical protein